MDSWIPIDVLPKRKLYEESVEVLCFIDIKGNPLQRVLTYQFWCNEFIEENIDETENDLYQYRHLITYWKPLCKNPEQNDNLTNEQVVNDALSGALGANHETPFSMALRLKSTQHPYSTKIATAEERKNKTDFLT